MSGSGKVYLGIIIFVVILAAPFVYNFTKASPPPKLELGTQEKQCVESKEFMKASHMILLEQWRDEVVRNNKRLYTSSTYPDKKFEMSLQNTCTKCHAKKTQFCDKCHTYTDAKPNCWDCHLPPKEKEQKAAARSDN